MGGLSGAGDTLTRGRWVRQLVRVAVGVAILEAVSWLIILLANRVLVTPIERNATFYARQRAAVNRFLGGDRDIWIFDSTLGWRTTASLGYGPRPSYPHDPPSGRIRVAAFGNSFVRGAEVPVAAAWLSQLEQQFPEIEAMNFGVAAFGTDQSLLQYRSEGRTRHGRIVLIGIAPDNFRRVVNVYRRFLSDGPPLTKPRFVLDEDHRLALRPNPMRTLADVKALAERPASVQRLGQFDQFYDPVTFENPLYDWSATVRLASALASRIRANLSSDRLERGGVVNSESAAYRLEHALIHQFAAEARADGAIPVVVLLPDRRSVERELHDRPGTLAPLEHDLVEEGLSVLDFTDALVEAARRTGTPALFTPGLHYSPQGGAAIAAWLGPKLLQLASHPVARH